MQCHTFSLSNMAFLSSLDGDEKRIQVVRLRSSKLQASILFCRWRSRPRPHSHSGIWDSPLAISSWSRARLATSEFCQSVYPRFCTLDSRVKSEETWEITHLTFGIKLERCGFWLMPQCRRFRSSKHKQPTQQASQKLGENGKGKGRRWLEDQINVSRCSKRILNDRRRKDKGLVE